MFCSSGLHGTQHPPPEGWKAEGHAGLILTAQFEHTPVPGHRNFLLFYLAEEKGVRRRADVLVGHGLARDTGRERCDMPEAPQ